MFWFLGYSANEIGDALIFFEVFGVKFQKK